ncbi:MAG: FtsX-like permease family protein [Planctomycetota bacterium]|nr:FtsX-like permease family protein [Planctomycetota bacterium]
MFRFALNNVLTRKLRSIFALVGLAIAVTGIIALISVSAGLRASVDMSLAMIDGLVVIRRDSVDPILSKIPASLESQIESIPGVRVAVPEIWELAPSVEGKNTLLEGMFTALAVFGVDPTKCARLKGGGLYGRHLKEGKFIEPGDEGQQVVVICTDVAEKYGKRIGDEISIAKHRFRIKGLYDTGVFFLNAALVMPIDVARKKQLFPPDVVSNFFVEVETPSQIPAVESAIEALSPDIDAKNTTEWSEEFRGIALNLDAFLVAIASIGILVGTIGILNTMLMSVMERVSEIGILKANGWRKGDILKLILFESLFLGLLGGLVGALFGWISAWVAGFFLPMEPVVHWWLIALSVLLASALGIAGGLYPAWYAAKLSPIEAIRFE